ncbi:MAG: segregation/condensation protein A [Oscillospiraceae bacterium]|jgi:segregation and condensation protein A|nr:segregation/condensation protein A [Oscillospiraceae bacterium]
MDDPVFRLAGVVKSKDESGDFEGPLTLILQLLSRNKIEIQDISISLILEQYLEYLGAMAEMDLHIASEFVAMASHLAYIKTRMLLTDREEISELESLISTLEGMRGRDAYARIKAVTPVLGDMYFSGAGLIVKPPEVIPADGEYKYSHERTDLLAALGRIRERGALKFRAQNRRPIAYPERIAYPVDEKIAEVVETLQRGGVMRVAALFASSRGRSETVATFIALLELCKLGRLFLAGEGRDMTVNLIEAA